MAGAELQYLRRQCDGGGARLALKLPTTAIGKDYPYDGQWLAMTPSGTGFRFNLGGYAGLTLGWLEGIEINLFGAVAGVEFRRPAINLPGLGRFGMAPA